MFQEDNLKKSIQEKYTVLAEQAEKVEDDEACGCGGGCGCGSSEVPGSPCDCKCEEDHVCCGDH